MNNKDSRKMLVPLHIQNNDFIKGREAWNNIVASDDETRSFKKVYNVQLEMGEANKPLADFRNDPRLYNDVIDVIEEDNKYSFLARSLVDLVSLVCKSSCQTCGGNTKRPLDEFSVIEPSTRLPFDPKLRITPNPASYRLGTEFDLSTMNSGEIKIRDIITGEVKKAEALNISSNRKKL